MTTPTLREAAMAALERFSADAAIDPRNAEAFETIRAYLCEEHEPVPLTDERIDHIADIVAKGMDGGIAGFCRTWGYQQFARALLDDCRGYYRDAPEQSPADGGQSKCHLSWNGFNLCGDDASIKEAQRLLHYHAQHEPLRRYLNDVLFDGSATERVIAQTALHMLAAQPQTTPAAPTSGEPVAWADPRDLEDATDTFIVASCEKRQIPGGDKLRFKVPLYAPPSAAQAEGAMTLAVAEQALSMAANEARLLSGDKADLFNAFRKYASAALTAAPEKLADCGNTPYDEGPFTLTTPPSAAQADDDLDEARCGPVSLASELRYRHENDMAHTPGYADSLLCRRTLAALTAAPEKLEGPIALGLTSAFRYDERLSLEFETEAHCDAFYDSLWLDHPPHQQAAQPEKMAPAPQQAGQRGTVDVLRAVQQQFRQYGNSFPDGFDGRVFRWVDDALASEHATPPSPQQAAQGGEREAKRLVSDLVFAVCAQENAPSALHHSQYVAAREAVEAALLARAAQGGREGLTKITRAIARLRPAVTGNGELAIAHRAGFSAAKQAAVEAVRGITTPAGDSAASHGGSGGGAA